MNLGSSVKTLLQDAGQAIAEYATMLAIILVLIIGMITLLENNALQLFIELAKSVK